MNYKQAVIAYIFLMVWSVLTSGFAQESVLPPSDHTPNIRLLPDYPLSPVQSVYYSPDGNRIYACGWDKVVHCWKKAEGKWEYDFTSVLRVPIGGGLDGALTTMAISDDGKYLATAGRGAKRGVAGQKEKGYLLTADTLSETQKLDEGLIYLFNLETQKTTILRGHHGTLIKLAFVPGADGKHQLISFGDAINAEGKSQPEFMAWDAVAGKRISLLDTYQDSSGKVTALPSLTPNSIPAFEPLGQLGNQTVVMISWPGNLDTLGIKLWVVETNTLVSAAALSNKIHFSFLHGKPESGRLTLLAGAGDPATGNGELRKIYVNGGNGVYSFSSETIKTFGQMQIPIVLSWLKSEKSKCLVGLLNFNTNDGETYVIDVEQKSSQKLNLEFKSNLSCAAHPQSQEIIWVNENNQLMQMQAGDSKSNPLMTPGSLDIKSVSYVQNQNQDGGLLCTTSQGAAYVFDFATMNLVTDIQGWTQINSQQVVINPVVDGQQYKMQVSGGGINATINAYLPEKSGTPEIVGQYICEPMPGVKLLVVGFNMRKQPAIHIYDLKSGELIRLYNAHTGPLTSLTCSQDQKLLYSSAKDGTIRGWWLGNIQEHLGKKGILRDKNQILTIKSTTQGIRVQQACQSLSANDIITECSSGKKSIKPVDTKSMYEWLLKVLPGEEIEVTTTRGKVKALSGQAVDWQRELFCLHLEKETDKVNWIAWSPLGPYDFSQQKLENYIGWHFHEDDVEHPVKYASAKELRETFYKPGFLQSLIKNGVIMAEKLTVIPNISLALDTENKNLQVDQSGDVLIRQTGEEITAKLNIASDFPLKFLKQIEWKLTWNHQPGEILKGTIPRGSDYDYPIHFKLPKDSKSGHFQLIANLVTNEDPPRKFNDVVSVRYQPPAPELNIEKIPTQLDQKPLKVKLELTSVEQTDVDLVLKLLDIDSQIIEEYEFKDLKTQSAVSKEIEFSKYTDGYYQLIVKAQNKNPLYGFENLESVSRKYEFIYTMMEEKKKAPQFVKLNISTNKENEPATDLLHATEYSGSVTEPTLSGEISSEIRLKKNCRIAVDQQMIDLELKETENAGQFSYILNSPVQLGICNKQQAIAYLKDEKDQEYKFPLASFTNLPALPELTVMSLSRIEEMSADARRLKQVSETVLVDGLFEPQVNLDLLYTQMNDFEKLGFKLVTDIDGVDVKLSDEKLMNGHATAKVEIPVGNHILTMKMMDAYGRITNSKSLSISRYQAPVAGKATLPETSSTGEVALSEIPIDFKSLKINTDNLSLWINGNAVPSAGKLEIQEGPEGKVVLKNLVFDQEGDNTLVLKLNTEAEFSQWELAKHVINVKKPVVVNIEIIPGSMNSKYDTDNFEFKSEIKSDHPLDYLKIKTSTMSYEFNAAEILGLRIQKNEPGENKLYYYQVSKPIPLSKGTNVIELDAQAKGTLKTFRHEASYIPKPPASGFISLGIPDASGHLVLTKTLDIYGKETYLGAASRAKAEIYGEFKISNSTDTNAQGFKDIANKKIQLRINGFYQNAIDILEKPGQLNTYSFRGQIILSEVKNNLLELRFPSEIPKDMSMNTTYQIDCQTPVLKQKLFMLLVGATPFNAPAMSKEELISQAKKALLTRENANQKLISDAFADIENIDRFVLTGTSANTKDIDHRLKQIKSNIEKLKRNTSQEDMQCVVIIFYKGAEYRINDPASTSNYALLTVDNWDKAVNNQKFVNNYTMTDDHIARELRDMNGAHLLFLDVNQVGQKTAAEKWEMQPYLGTIRIVNNDRNPNADVSYNSTLLEEMQKALPKSHRLSQLKNNLMTQFSGDSSESKIDLQIPKMLENLVIGPEQK